FTWVPSCLPWAGEGRRGAQVQGPDVGQVVVARKKPVRAGIRDLEELLPRRLQGVDHPCTFPSATRKCSASSPWCSEPSHRSSSSSSADDNVPLLGISFTHRSALRG